VWGTTVLVAVVLALLCAGIGSYISYQKGRSEAEGALFGFFLGPLGLLIAAMLPTIYAQPASYERFQENNADICPDCLSVVPKAAKKCRFCGSWIESVPAEESTQAQAEGVESEQDSHELPHGW